MSVHVRVAEPGDVEAIASVSRRRGRRLDGWEPDHRHPVDVFHARG